MTEITKDTLPAKVVQIQSSSQRGGHNHGEHIQLFALCEDGTVWVKYLSHGGANVPEDGLWRNMSC